MPRTDLTAVVSQAFGEGVADVGFEAVDNANGNQFANDGNTDLLVSNGSGGSLTVTITTPAGPRTVNAAVTKTLAVANGDTAHFGPFDPSIFNSSGKVLLDWSTGTSVTAAVVKRTPTPR